MAINKFSVSAQAALDVLLKNAEAANGEPLSEKQVEEITGVFTDDLARMRGALTLVEANELTSRLAGAESFKGSALTKKESTQIEDEFVLTVEARRVKAAEATRAKEVERSRMHEKRLRIMMPHEGVNLAPARA